MAEFNISLLALLCVSFLTTPSYSNVNKNNVSSDKQTDISNNKDDKRNAGEVIRITRMKNKGKKVKNRNKKEKNLERKYKKKSKQESKKTRKVSTKIGKCIGTTSHWSCCSFYSQCQRNEGDCDRDSDCAGSLVCGKDNCRNFNPLAHPLADCCVGACSGTNTDWSCCSSTSPCLEYEGDCDRDSECAGSLVCGYNNCKQFNPLAEAAADCCIKPQTKATCGFDDKELSTSNRSPVETSGRYVWKSGKVPYYFKGPVSTKDKTLIRKAMRQIEERTCIRFEDIGGKPPSGIHLQAHHLEITVGDKSCNPSFFAWVTADCYPTIKFVSKYQLEDDISCNYGGAVLHELFHALGIYHTQKRTDRDKYVRVHEENIDNLSQYEICQGCKVYSSIPYDCESIMHYGFKTAMVYPYQGPTMTAIDKNTCKLTAQGPSFEGKREATKTDWDLLNILATKMCGTPISSTTTPEQVPCPVGWTLLATACYKFLDKVTYNEGVMKCKQDGGYLVEITSQEEQDTLWQFYQDSGLPLRWVWGVSSVWIGANDLAKDGEWRLEYSRRKMAYSAWYKDERHDEPNGGTKENCAQAWGHLSFKWNDLYCGYKLGALCELGCDTSMRVGTEVVRNDLTWKWQNHDGGTCSKGIVTSLTSLTGKGNGWIWVKWDNGYEDEYRWGHGGNADVKVSCQNYCDTAMRVGAKVVRDEAFWRYGDQDGGPGSVGTITAVFDNYLYVHWELVDTWDNYRWSQDGKTDVKVFCEG